MPHESTPQPTGLLSGETVAVLREAVHRRLTDQSTDHELREVLRRLSAEARAKGLHAEQVIIALKRAWGGLPKASRPHDPDEEYQMLARLVTLCIDDYYAAV